MAFEGELTPDLIDAVRKHLESEGTAVLSSKALGERLQKEREKGETQVGELNERLEALEKEKGALEKFKRKIEDEGKTQDQLHKDEVKRLSDQSRAQLDKLADLEKALENEKAGRKADKLNVHFSRLMGNSPINREMALLWANTKNPGFAVNDDGDFVFSDPEGRSYEGKAAEKAFADWMGEDAQRDLIKSNPPGPPVKNVDSPPPQKPDTYNPDRNQPLEERLRHAAQYQGHE